MSENVNEYLNWQNYNIITKYLHSIRYLHLNTFLSSLPESTLNVFEIGCGYGKSLELLKRQNKVKQYFGIDIENQFIDYCQNKYVEDQKENNSHQFLYADIRDYATGKKELPFKPDAIIALECFEHIPEYDIPKIISWIATLQCPVFISVPNEMGPAILVKNVGSCLLGYIRHQEYTWAETIHASLGNLEKVRPHDTGHRGFDWRWLRAALHQKLEIRQIGTSPINLIPRWLSPSIYFYCHPR